MSHIADTSLRDLLQDRSDEIIQDWAQRLRVVGGNYGRDLIPLTELDAEMRALLAGLAMADERFDTDPAHPLAQALRSTGALRAARGFTPEESVLFLLCCKDAVLARLHGDADSAVEALEALQAQQLQRADAEHLEHLAQVAQAAQRERQERQTLLVRLVQLMDRCVLVLMGSFIDARDRTLLSQGEALREASTPVITLWDSILLLPLVGVVDSVRAQLISERLLEAVSQAEAEVTLIDVTGVPLMDTSVARHILKTVAAAEMLGTRVILTGISPTTAQTMVKLGIDLSSVPTRGSLKGGVALAMAMTRRRVVDLQTPAAAG